MKKFIFTLICILTFHCANAEYKTITINTDNSSLILGVGQDGKLYSLHYGAKIANPDDMSLWNSYRRQDYSMDPPAYSTEGGRYFNEAALSVTYADGSMNTELVFENSQTELAGNVATTRIYLQDPKTGLKVTLTYVANAKEDVIVCHSEITNASPRKVTLRNYYSSHMHIRAQKYLLTHFYGSWAREMNVDREFLTHGIKCIESKMEVRTTHMENPSFLLSLNTGDFNENYGEVIAGAFAWSGNYKLSFEMNETGEVDILAGINPYSGEYTLGKGESMVTPDMVYTYSDKGAGQASRNLHDWARNGAIYAKSFVPTLLNSWEGAYFNFNTKTLTGMIDDAASMGLEMFVLDDGWFGKKYPRNDSKQGLGDWCVNTDKIPEGIAYLADYAHSKGLKFGIWIEPEMVNPKSELYEKHPDWVVAEAGREKTTIRSQLLLDLSNPAVQDFVFSVFDNTMQLSPGIDYVKWDANRHVENMGSSYLKEQSKFWVEYARGFYSVLERIRAKYPDTMIQACSSGGGRVEYGALKYFDEVWTSDDTEARQRAKIQYGTNMIYPALVTGSHVSASPNHQTKNVTPIKFRFDVATAGRLGMELQPKDLTPEEREFAVKAIASYKSYRDIVQNGDLYRILSPYESDFYSLMYVSKDKKRAVVFAYCLEYQGRVQKPQLRLYGLNPEYKYTLTELNVPKPRFWGDGKTFGGDFLIGEGISPNLATMYDSSIFYLESK